MFGKTVFIEVGHGLEDIPVHIPEKQMKIFKKNGFDPKSLVTEIRDNNKIPEIEVTGYFNKDAEKKLHKTEEQYYKTRERQHFQNMMETAYESIAGAMNGDVPAAKARGIIMNATDARLLALTAGHSFTETLNGIIKEYQWRYDKVYRYHCEHVFNPNTRTVYKNSFKKDDDDECFEVVPGLNNDLTKLQELKIEEDNGNLADWRYDAYMSEVAFLNFPTVEKILFNQRIKNGWTDGTMESDPIVWMFEHYADVFTFEEGEEPKNVDRLVPEGRSWKVAYKAEYKHLYKKTYRKVIEPIKQDYYRIFYNNAKAPDKNNIKTPDFESDSWKLGAGYFFSKLAKMVLVAFLILEQNLLDPSKHDRKVHTMFKEFMWHEDGTYPFDLEEMVDAPSIKDFMLKTFPMPGDEGNEEMILREGCPNPDNAFYASFVHMIYFITYFMTMNAGDSQGYTFGYGDMIEEGR